MTWDISWEELSDKCSEASEKNHERVCTRNSGALRRQLEEDTDATWVTGHKPSENFHPYAFLYFDHIGIDSLVGCSTATDKEVSSDEFVRLLKKLHPKRPKRHTLIDRIAELEKENDELNTRLKQKNAEVNDLIEVNRLLTLETPHTCRGRIAELERENDELNTRLKQKNAEVNDLNGVVGKLEILGRLYIKRIYKLEEEVRKLEGENSILSSKISGVRLLTNRKP